MNTEPSKREEAPERLKQIRERLAAHRVEAEKYDRHEWAKGRVLDYNEAPDDVDFLLSLVDNAATRMRERCVARVKNLRVIAQPTDYEATIWNRIIDALGSLTLEAQ